MVGEVSEQVQAAQEGARQSLSVGERAKRAHRNPGKGGIKLPISVRTRPGIHKKWWNSSFCLFWAVKNR
eukprot:917066-Pelagomonas_calceolata.AAC.5